MPEKNLSENELDPSVDLSNSRKYDDSKFYCLNPICRKYLKVKWSYEGEYCTTHNHKRLYAGEIWLCSDCIEEWSKQINKCIKGIIELGQVAFCQLNANLNSKEFNILTKLQGHLKAMSEKAYGE